MRVRFALAAAVLAVVSSACRAPVQQSGGTLAPQGGAQARPGPPAIPGVDGPLAETRPDVPAPAWRLGAPIVVSTAELMARGAGVARDRTEDTGIHKVRPDRSNLLQNPDAPPVAQWPPSPNFRETPPSVAFSAATPNVDVAVRADTGNVMPPDTMGDVGPTQYLVGLNGRVRTIRKSDGVADGVLDLDSDVFYGAAANGAPTGDPRVRYDRRAGRWYVLMFNIAVPNRYLLAVSNTATITPSTTWAIWFWNNTRTQGGVGGGAGCLGDYPTLGVDEDALYIGVNQFCGTSLNTISYDSSSAYVLPKAPLLAGAGGAPTVFQFDAVVVSGGAGPYTPQGVDNFDNGTNQGYFIGVDNLAFSTLVLRRVNNPGTTPSLSANVNITVPTTVFPKTVPQPPGASREIDGLDDRLLHAVIRNGTLWTLHQIEVNASGVGDVNGNRDGQRWYQLGNLGGAPTIVQSGTIFDNAATNPVHHWMGALMVNGQGHVAMGLSRSGAAAFVNTEFTGRLASDPLGTMNAPTAYSNNTATVYNLQTTSTQRWGDYSYTSVDPNDDMTMWTLQEYPNASTSYAVRLVRLLAPPPAAIASVSPNTIASGATGLTLTITGTSSAGSGFFDPGAGFPNRLAAAFSGGGITVTNVQYNSPTSITLTVNTTGAAPGARTLTITNPDGQQSALASAVTVVGGGGGVFAPANFRVTGMSGANVTFAWDLPPGGLTPTSLLLEGGLTPGTTIGAIPLGVMSSITLGLPNGSFFVRLKSLSGGTVSAPSNEIPVHVNVPVAPSTPAHLLGLVNGATLALAWTPTFTGGQPTGVVLDVSGPVAGSLPLGLVETFSFAGVPPGTYNFSVRQTNAAGTSLPSNVVTLTFPGGCSGVPAMPANFAATAAGGVLTLFWEPPTSGPAPTSYVLNVSGAFVGAVPFTTRGLVVPVPPGTYNFTLLAANPCGGGVATPLRTVTIP